MNMLTKVKEDRSTFHRTHQIFCDTLKHWLIEEKRMKRMRKRTV